MRTLPRMVIAAASSGAGKTSFTLGLLGALSARGLDVRAFKAGPDYIDTSLHAAVLGKPSRNLDPRLMGSDAVLACLARNGHGADIAVIEGVMGFYDGATQGASTSDLAGLIESPVLLLLDAGASAESAGAVALGFARHPGGQRIAGVVLNRIAGPSHFEVAAMAVTGATGLPVLGYLPADGSLGLPERHLGLVAPGETPEFRTVAAALAREVEDHVDLEALLSMARAAPALAEPPACHTEQAVPRPRLRVAVARDAAFSFHYEDNFDAMRDTGIEPVFFSPLADGGLPAGTSGLYLGGGYPELFAGELARNSAMRDSIRGAAEEGLPVFAECGGYLYLLEALEDTGGSWHEGCKVLPGRAFMGKALAALGYREGRTRTGTVLGPAGTELSGHVFHFSWVEGSGGVLDLGTELDGSSSRNVFGSYLHLHFARNPVALGHFAEACLRYARSREARPS